MRKLLSAPVKMGLSENDNNIYQQALKHATEISLNLMAVKVEDRPEDFTGWCNELHRLCRDKLNYDLLEPEQLPIVKKLQSVLEKGVSLSQLKMLRITPWPFFVEYIKQNSEQISLEERLKLLAHVDSIKASPLNELSELDRLTIAGKHTANHDPGVYAFDNEWFASTKASRAFHALYEQRSADFAQALNRIPLEGEVSRTDYLDFVDAYKTIFKTGVDGQPSDEKAPLLPATRLLAMRRPDQFVTLSNVKMDMLCLALGCRKLNNADFVGYWDEVVETVRACAWWKQEQPEDEQELAIWQNRAVFIDAFFFADKNSPLESNYLKLKDRIANGRTASAARNTTARKRSKETAEQIVDKRLEDPELPAYLQNRRDSLVHEVKNGKSVDEAINLFRAIFG
jgi:hypothetical protein